MPVASRLARSIAAVSTARWSWQVVFYTRCRRELSSAYSSFVDNAHTNLSKLCGRLQVFFIRSIRYHECVAVRESDIIIGVAHFAVLGTEVAIEYYRTCILPPATFFVSKSLGG